MSDDVYALTVDICRTIRRLYWRDGSPIYPLTNVQYGTRDGLLAALGLIACRRPLDGCSKVDPEGKPISWLIAKGRERWMLWLADQANLEV